MSVPESQVWRSSGNWRVQSPNAGQNSPGAGSQSAWRTPGGRSGYGRGGFNAGRAGGSGDQQQDPAAAEGRRIYVGNVPYDVEAAEVEALLSDSGFPGAKVKMSLNHETRRNPGYCFADFADKQTADIALENLGGITLRDRQLRVGPCQQKKPQSEYQSTGDRRGDRQDRSSGSPFGGQRSSDWAPRERSYGGTPDPATEEKRRLYVGGLPRMETQEECEQNMRELFAGFDIESVSKPIAPPAASQDKPGNHYYCFVDFTATEEASRAEVAFNGQPYADGALRIGPAKSERKPRDHQSVWNRPRFGAQDGGAA
ncbi:putative rna recognition domain-containing protein [Phaeoacremonium minimum UCRPA7]|uniref:Putative rna recognition domain-containing protein n=1 Tax=Phaeoacremonium minimum (strain UCR-PA7) TaxID=1286976 RepID=R8BH69_PHAM7|nr:putative rna recognition domain-containing protein [Phaeoacremonium minimum UCRPA7]EON98658.1 putative rna recognition domain-containing protein [Phaeoacremonium minimum UCRPA7]